MMYLIPDPVVTKQFSGNVESSPSRPSPSKSYQNAEKSSPSLLSYAKSPSSHRRRCYSSDEEDDSRDRQSHWKRIKTRPDDNPRGSTRNLIRYTERDYENSPPRIRLQAPPQSPKPRPSANPRPGHRVIVLKGSADEKGVGLRRLSLESSEGRTSSGSKAWDGAVGMCVRDGGTTSTDIDLGGNKRKQDLMSAFGNASRSSLMMSERSMVVREKLAARRAPVEKKYEFRVSDREVGEFVYGEDDDSLSFEDSRQFYDDYPPRSMSGSDLREILNRRGRAEEAMSREARVYGDYRTAERGGFDASVRVRRVEFDLSAGNGKVQGSTVRKVLDLGRSSRSGNDDGKERASVGIGGFAASVGAKSERDMESERRQEKRERWAVKERDLEKELEKENMLKAAQQAKVKSVTVVDYSHKFTLAKAPISVPAKPVETDPHRLCQRQKQIDYGKNTLGYERYTDMIPRYQRTKAHPRTPDIRQVCSKRSWDGQIRKWRRLLHEFDPPKDEDEEDPEQMLVLRREPVRSTEYVEDTLMDMQAEYGEEQDLKIYEGWSDDEC